jgi:hypothetical protein
MKHKLFAAIVICISLGCTSTDQPPEEEELKGKECVRIVGSTLSETRVYNCKDPISGMCFLYSSNGGILEVPCEKHPLAKENPYDE